MGLHQIGGSNGDFSNGRNTGAGPTTNHQMGDVVGTSVRAGATSSFLINEYTFVDIEFL